MALALIGALAAALRGPRYVYDEAGGPGSGSQVRPLASRQLALLAVMALWRARQLPSPSRARYLTEAEIF
jgi:hypothetical protein